MWTTKTSKKYRKDNNKTFECKLKVQGEEPEKVVKLKKKPNCFIMEENSNNSITWYFS